MSETKLFPLCARGEHWQCIGGYARVETADGQVLPAISCCCECHRDPDQGVPA